MVKSLRSILFLIFFSLFTYADSDLTTIPASELDFIKGYDYLFLIHGKDISPVKVGYLWNAKADLDKRELYLGLDPNKKSFGYISNLGHYRKNFSVHLKARPTNDHYFKWLAVSPGNFGILQYYDTFIFFLFGHDENNQVMMVRTENAYPQGELYSLTATYDDQNGKLCLGVANHETVCEDKKAASFVSYQLNYHLLGTSDLNINSRGGQFYGVIKDYTIYDEVIALDHEEQKLANTIVDQKCKLAEGGSHLYYNGQTYPMNYDSDYFKYDVATLKNGDRLVSCTKFFQKKYFSQKYLGLEDQYLFTEYILSKCSMADNYSSFEVQSNPHIGTIYLPEYGLFTSEYENSAFGFWNFNNPNAMWPCHYNINVKPRPMKIGFNNRQEVLYEKTLFGNTTSFNCGGPHYRKRRTSKYS